MMAPGRLYRALRSERNRTRKSLIINEGTPVFRSDLRKFRWVYHESTVAPAILSPFFPARRGGHSEGYAYQPTCQREESLPAAARPQPGGLVPVGAGSVRKGPPRRQAHLPFHRLLHLPLVPRHGARVVRERSHRRAAEPRLRAHQGGSRRAPGRGPHLHDLRAGHHRRRRLAHVRLAHARSRSRSSAAPTFRPRTATGIRASPPS